MVVFFKVSNLLKFGCHVFLFLAFFSVLTLVACTNGESDNGVVVPDQDSSSSVQDDLKVESSSSEWYKKGAFLNPDIEYGTLVDERDGKTYKTVVIGNRTWMAENLNYGEGDCVDDRDEGCNVLGRLYYITSVTWKDSTKLKRTGGVWFYRDYQGICPDGWRVPSNNDWDDLINATTDDVLGASEVKLFSKTMYFAEGINQLDEKLEKMWFFAPSDSLGFSLPPMEINYWSNDPIVKYVRDTLYDDYGSGQIVGVPYALGFSSFFDTGHYMVAGFRAFTYLYGAIRCVKGGGVGEFRTREDLLNENVKYDTLVDERDGHVYRTYNGIMAENLNYDWYGEDYKSECYNENKKNCEMYGRLYEKFAIQKAGPDGPCPEGWRMISNNEIADIVPNYIWDADGRPNFYGVNTLLYGEYSLLAKGWFVEDNQRDSITAIYNPFPAGYFGKDVMYRGIGSIFAVYFWDENVRTKESELKVFSFDVSSGLDGLDIVEDEVYAAPVRCAKKDTTSN